MYTIAALGNPGEKYERTRHNAGRLVVSAVAARWGLPAPVASAKYGGRVSEGVAAGEEVRVLFPDSYMNESGGAVAKAVGGGASDRLIVVYDEIDLPLGEFKISFGRGSGGHNGLRSVIDRLGTKDFARVRVGIGPKSFFGRLVRPRGEKLADYVLGTLTAREEKRLFETVPAVAEALETILREGKERAMSKFN